MSAEVRIKLFANSLPSCRICLSGNEKALENINVFKGFSGCGGAVYTQPSFKPSGTAWEHCRCRGRSQHGICGDRRLGWPLAWCCCWRDAAGFPRLRMPRGRIRRRRGWSSRSCAGDRRAVSADRWLGGILLPVGGAGPVRLGGGAGQFMAAGIAAEIGATGGSGDCSVEPGPKGPPHFEGNASGASAWGIEARDGRRGLMLRRAAAKPGLEIAKGGRGGGVGRSRWCRGEGLLYTQVGGADAGLAVSAPKRSRARRGDGRASGSGIG